MSKIKRNQTDRASVEMPSAEEVQQELAGVTSMDDFFGKDGVFARLFARTLEQMLEAELTGGPGLRAVRSQRAPLRQ